MDDLELRELRTTLHPSVWGKLQREAERRNVPIPVLVRIALHQWLRTQTEEGKRRTQTEEGKRV